MKIAFLITSTGWGGLEMNVLKLAELLSGRGYSISLITQENSTIYSKGKNLFNATLILKNKKKYFDFSSAKIIGDYLEREGIDTVIVCDNKDLDVAAWAKKIYFKALNILYHQQMQIGVNKKDFLHTFRFKAINYWISPLQYLRNEIAEKTKFPIERVKVIPLCTDSTKFINKKYTKQEALQLLNIAPKAPLVGIIGRIDRKKGQLFLVESFIKLKQQGIDIELLVFGSATVNSPEESAYYTSMRKIVQQHSLEKVVHFVDFREDVSLFYNAVDVFVLGSHSETFGMVTIEAMLSKLPIIATKSGGTSEILEYGKLGLLYEYENYEDFSKQLKWILNNRSEAENMAALAQKTASEKYALDVEGDGIDRLLQELHQEKN